MTEPTGIHTVGSGQRTDRSDGNGGEQREFDPPRTTTIPMSKGEHDMTITSTFETALYRKGVRAVKPTKVGTEAGDPFRGVYLAFDITDDVRDIVRESAGEFDILGGDFSAADTKARNAEYTGWDADCRETYDELLEQADNEWMTLMSKLSRTTELHRSLMLTPRAARALAEAILKAADEADDQNAQISE